jgi:hypothetical protein
LKTQVLSSWPRGMFESVTHILIRETSEREREVKEEAYHPRAIRASEKHCN